MDELLETRLIECLDALEAGESVEQVLARYPGEADALRPLLVLAGALPHLRQQPAEIARARSRRAFLAAGTAQPARPVLPRLVQTLSLAAAVAVLVAAFGLGLVALSGGALPGDALYPVKRGYEQARLFLAPAESRPFLARELKEQRINEIEALLAGGRQARVTLEGPLDAVLPDTWLVAGIVVNVDASTRIEGNPQPGQVVIVEGVTAQGTLRATAIRLAANQPTVPLPEATDVPPPTSVKPVPTPLPTATPDRNANDNLESSQNNENNENNQNNDNNENNQNRGSSGAGNENADNDDDDDDDD